MLHGLPGPSDASLFQGTTLKASQKHGIQLVGTKTNIMRHPLPWCNLGWANAPRVSCGKDASIEKHIL